jgi:hypothetical protein
MSETTDIVAELAALASTQRPLRDWDNILGAMLRARDEILALRERAVSLTEAFARIREATDIKAKARTEALEEAARVCDEMANTRAYDRPYTAYYEECAATIRALKDDTPKT